MTNWRACYTAEGYPKLRFETRKDAKKVVHLVNRRSKSKVVHAYRCPICGYFHTGRES